MAVLKSNQTASFNCREYSSKPTKDGAQSLVYFEASFMTKEKRLTRKLWKRIKKRHFGYRALHISDFYYYKAKCKQTHFPFSIRLHYDF